MSTTERRKKVVKGHPRLSLVQQCKLLKNPPFRSILQAQEREPVQSKADEGYRRPIYGTSLLWRGAYDGLPKT